MAMGNYVFISYSSARADAAAAIRTTLEQAGISTWMAPRDIPPGSSYAQSITSAIKYCSCFLLLLTAEAQSSIWIPKETERAVSYRKPIIPVMLENVRLNEEFEFYISSSQIIQIDDVRRPSDSMQRLLYQVQAFCGQAQRPVGVSPSPAGAGPRVAYAGPAPNGVNSASAYVGPSPAGVGPSSGGVGPSFSTVQATGEIAQKKGKLVPAILWIVEIVIILMLCAIGVSVATTVGGLGAGVLLGLIPMLLARKKDKYFLSNISWPIVTIASTLIGLFGSIPAIVVFLILIFKREK